MADHRPDVYTRDDGVTVFRASSFSACDRRLIAAGQGLDPAPVPERMLEVFARGQAAEWPILTALASNRKKVGAKWRADGTQVQLGYNILDPKLAGSYRQLGEWVSREPHDGQFYVEVPVGKDMVIAGHLDGVGSMYLSGDFLVEVDTAWVLEAKRFGPDLFDKWKAGGVAAFPWYDSQTDLYMHATGLPVIFLVGQGNDPAGEDPDGFGQVWAELKTAPTHELGWYRSRARRLKKQIDSGVLPGECARGVEYPCPFFWLHDDAGKERIDLTTREGDPQVRQIAELAARIAPISKRIKVDEGTVKALKAELKELVVAVAGGEGRAVLTQHYDISHVVQTWEAGTIERKAGSRNYVQIKPRKEED